MFEHVEVTGSDPYFQRAGLLFLDLEQLRSLQGQLREGRSALAVLASQPNLLGIARFIDLLTVGAKVKIEMPPSVPALVREMAEVTRAQAAGSAAALDGIVRAPNSTTQGRPLNHVSLVTTPLLIDTSFRRRRLRPIFSHALRPAPSGGSQQVSAQTDCSRWTDTVIFLSD
jgi:hypothetical protein